MPKLLHTLCCCVVRPKKSASKKLSNNNNNKETGNSVVVVGNNNGGGSGGGGGKSKGKRNKKRDYYDAVNEAASARQQPTRSADDCWNGEQTSGTPASQVAASSIITQVSKTGNDASTSNAISNSPTQTTTISNNNNNNNVGKNNFKQNAKRLIGLGGKSSEKATAAAAAAANASPSADAVPTLSITSPTPANNNLLLNNAAELSRQRERLRESVSADVVQHLLPRPHAADSDKKCLIVDLDETLVHSSFKPVKNADFVIPVEIDNVVHQVYVLKRPHADEFLERVGSLFECVLFTASLAKYADPVADLLDRRGIFRARLFREACVFFEGNYVKDLDRLGRQLEHVVIIDNSPASYAFHPFNAVAVRTWFDDPHDTELLELLPVLEEIAKGSDVYSVLGGGGGGRNSRLGLPPQVSDAVAATTVVVSTTTSPSGATTITTTTTMTTNIAVGRNPRYNNNNNNNYQQQHKMNYDPDTAGSTNNNYYGAMPLQSSSPISSVSNSNNSNNNGYGSYYGSEREHQQQRWKNNNNNNSSSYAANQRYYGSAGGSGTPTTQRGPTETTVSRTIELTRR